MTTTRTKPTKLTERQRNFALLLFQNYTQRDAYLQVYNPTVKDPNVIDADASHLANHPKILQELSNLRAQLEPETIMSKQQLAKITADIAKSSQNETTRLKAGHLLAQLLGYYAPARTESKELVRFLVEYRNRDAVIPLASVPQPLLDAPRSMIVPAIEGTAIQLPERTDEPSVT